ncbi:UNVERIFIED_ORG: hypothetical protein LHK14_17700 [Roseateles sp. XES5]|nr:hypothetical protein [Roseateles sp. XES5]
MTPRTADPDEWLRYVADLAEQHRLSMLTAAGANLQTAFIAFLREASAAGAPVIDLQADLLTMLPRFHNALIQASHGGAACVGCCSKQAIMLFDEITTDMREMRDRQRAGGMQ